jgi:hypothetical protein
MRITISEKHAKSYISRDRLIGEAENFLNSVAGADAKRVPWIDVPIYNDVLDTASRWTAVFFLPSELGWLAGPIAHHGFKVCN